MRFEVLHQYFKELVKRVRNFRNITLTLAERFMRKRCCEYAQSECLGLSTAFPEYQKVITVQSSQEATGQA